MTIDHLVGQRVTVRGVAGDAAGGAVVLAGEGTPVYLARMARWDTLAGSTIEVTGELDRTEIAPLRSAPGEPASHGAPGRQYVLRNYTPPRSAANGEGPSVRPA
ncbi:hypothetical protein EV385_5725 [Krasilnikovia cinnamomea]|uniref:Uncharacterized protein n=1 Tax=Krasilnikovia cinnamomea TaxID=349313 RepID=A0A4Q7ZSJ5_9ACTN|nr:hypothetical protein [Krasilnikovia cinnamomea]RZU53791.1 hypothetical protein EV385_5725 [Krasilnikovia cinnamomea]